SIYNSTTFKEIQSMLKEIVEKMEKKEINRVEPHKEEFEDGYIVFENENINNKKYDVVHFETKNNQSNSVRYYYPYILSYRLINNQQDLVIINVERIK